jgi:hypothetical protein
MAQIVTSLNGGDIRFAPIVLKNSKIEVPKISQA